MPESTLIPPVRDFEFAYRIFTQGIQGNVICLLLKVLQLNFQIESLMNASYENVAVIKILIYILFKE
jgi:hypothetical protein